MGDRHRIPARAAIAGAIAALVALASVGVAFAADTTSGAKDGSGHVATRRVVPAQAPPARVPLDAAVSARARVEAEQAMQAMHDAQVAQYYAAVAEYYRPKTGVNWDGIARCETGGNWSMRGASFSGGLGFYNGTWTAFGGRDFAPNAGMATREQQIVVAERVYARYGLSGWGCRAYG